MSRAKSSLRRRVATGLALLSLFVIGLQGVTAYLISQAQEEELIDQVVADEMGYLIDRYQLNPGVVPATGVHLQAYIATNDAERAALPEFIRSLGAGAHEVITDSNVEYHIAVRRHGGVGFYLLYDVTQHDERFAHHLLSLIISLIILALISIWLSFRLAGALIRQIIELAQRVERITPGENSVPLAQTQQDEEVATVARAFDKHQQKMAQLIEREQSFTADVSHELRTPLTAIKTGCELLAQDDSLQPRSRVRLESISLAAERMAQLIQNLLYLARHEQVGESEDVQLLECVVEAAEPFLGLLNSKGLGFTVQIDPQLILSVNRQALQLVLTNLIKNAIDYTEQGSIRLYHEGEQIFIEDTGQGISALELPHIFKRLYRAQTDPQQGEGHGLGLAIARRVCDRHGWQLEVESALGRGTKFSLSFAAGTLAAGVSATRTLAAATATTGTSQKLHSDTT